MRLAAGSSDRVGGMQHKGIVSWDNLMHVKMPKTERQSHNGYRAGGEQNARASGSTLSTSSLGGH